MYERILVCLDGSKLAEQILPHARELAWRFGSRLVLLRVIGEAQIYTSPGEPKVVVEQMERSREDKQEAEEYLAALSGTLRSYGFDVDSAVVGGPPGETIVRFADQNGVGLIALATQGRSGLGRMVFGSVADYVLRHASVPILCIRPRHSED